VLSFLKRRSAIYTLSLVIVIGSSVTVGALRWHRSQLIATLSEEIAHGEPREATAAVRQLAAIPIPPLEFLVELAASNDHNVAETAQVAINQLLERSKRETSVGKRLSHNAARLDALASAISERQRAFPRGYYPWLAATTRSIVEIANKCAAKDTTLIALRCDQILANVRPPRPVSPPPQERIGVPSVVPTAAEPEISTLESAFDAFPAQSVLSQPPAPKPIESVTETAQETTAWKSRDSTLPAQRSINEQSQIADDGEARPDWAQPPHRMMSAKPAGFHPNVPLASVQSKASSETQPTAITDAQLVRDLLQQWHDSRGKERKQVDEQLAERGFVRLSPRIVDQYFSQNLADRLRLVDSVLTEPGVDPRPWLLLLAADENAEVRLMAVTVMATSEDQSLIEKAWQAAIRDRDSRIADLASRLRDQRDKATRR
jgi:hypothetical protein